MLFTETFCWGKEMATQHKDPKTKDASHTSKSVVLNTTKSQPKAGAKTNVLKTFAVVIPYSIRVARGKIKKIEQYLTDLGAKDVKEVYNETWSPVGRALGDVKTSLDAVFQPENFFNPLDNTADVENTRYIAVLEYDASKDLQPELEAKVCQEMMCYAHKGTGGYFGSEDIWGYLWTITDYKKGDAKKIRRGWVDGPMKNMTYGPDGVLGEGKSMKTATETPRRKTRFSRSSRRKSRSRKSRARRKSRSRKSRARRKSRSRKSRARRKSKSRKSVSRKSRARHHLRK